MVLSHASAFYLDVAHEPDPDELGAYLGTRFTETRDTFNYMPDSVYDNIEVDLFGRPLDRDELCNEVGCERLLPGNEDNVIGMFTPKKYPVLVGDLGIDMPPSYPPM